MEHNFLIFLDNNILSPHDKILEIGSSTTLHCNALHVKGWIFLNLDSHRKKVKLEKPWNINLHNFFNNTKTYNHRKTIALQMITKNNEGVYICAGCNGTIDGYFYAASLIHVKGELCLI